MDNDTSIERLSFSTDAAIIGRLGQELVAKQETALVELVKNAFDADSTEVTVTLVSDPSDRHISIIDNGSGMSRTELVDGFLRLASSLKARAPRSPKFRRRRAGKKGIGRFAAQRLGRSVELTTRTEEEELGRRLIVNWDEFASGRALEDVPVDLVERVASPVGTSMVIRGLRDPWSDAQIRRCWRGVVALQQPFPVAPVLHKPESDPGFTVSFLRGHAALSGGRVVANINSEILNHLHAVFEMRVSEAGQAEWRISKNKFGATQDWTPIHHDAKQGSERYEHLKSIYLKAYYFILDAEYFSPTVYTRLRDVLSSEGGIRLYRNGFRVIPYGDPHDDWLRLDEAYGKRSLLAPISNKNFFGLIEIGDEAEEDFEEHTSREGLIETPAFLELRDLASSVLITAATRIAEDRGRKTRAGRARLRPPAPTSSLSDVKRAINAVMAEAGAALTPEKQNELREAAKTVDRAEQALNQQMLEVEEAAKSLADEAAMLRLLATLGMVTAEFNHETGMTFEAFRADFAAVFEAAIQSNINSKFIEQADRARTMLERLDALTSYLNSLSGSRATRDVSPQSVSLVLEDFERGIRAQADSHEVELSVETPAFDPLFSAPIHRAELASVLLNLYTNSLKAMVRAGGERRVTVSAARSEDSSIRILFSDTGDGVPTNVCDRIFDAFYTTQSAPSSGAPEVDHVSGTGLGLWIVKQIVESVNGVVRLVDPNPGFVTTFEVVLPAEDEGEKV